MVGSDDGTYRDGSASESRRNPSIPAAKPNPLTEAMIKPRSDRFVFNEPAGGRQRFCHSCGVRNESAGSYCLSCGVSFRRRDRPSTARPTSGSAKAATGWQAAGSTEPSVSTQGDNESGEKARSRAPRGSVRSFAASIIVIAALLLGFNTLSSREPEVEAPVEPVSSTTTATTVDLTALRLYGNQISMLGSDVEDVAATGRSINDDWAERAVEYQPAKDRMRALVHRVTAISARMAEIVPPPEADPIAHRQMLLEIATLVSAAEGMMAGLESTDTGQARLAELARFEAAAREFGLLAGEVEESL